MKRFARVEAVIVLSCLAWSQAASGAVSPEDVRAALEEIAEQQKGKIIAFGRPLVTKEAQSRFAKFGDEAVPELRKCVEDKGVVDLNAALLLLGCLRGETGWNLLESYARGADVRLRSHAVLVLGSLGTERSVSLLNELALDPATAHGAITSLGSLVGVAIWYGGSIPGPMEEHVSVRTEPPPSTRALEALKTLLAEKRCPQRPRVFAILAAAAPEDVQGLLPEFSRDEEAEVRLRATGLLRKADLPEAAALARALARDEDAKVRFAATEALVELGDAAAVPVLAAFLGSEDKQQSYKAFLLARELESIDGLRERLVELLSSDDPDVACRAAGILHYHRDRRGVDFLVRELRAHRHEAARALGWSTTPDDLPALIPMMDDPDFDVRSSVLGLLLDFDDERVLDWVLCHFHRYDDFDRGNVCYMKGQMIEYVSSFPNEEALWLLRIQFGRDERIRDYAARALYRIPNRGALPILRQLLRHYEDSDFASIPSGIARMGGKEEVDLLLDCLDRSRPGRQLYQQATRALQVITGENLEGDAWRAWWKEHRDVFDPVAARIKSLSGPLVEDSLFFLTIFAGDTSRDALRRELARRRENSREAVLTAKALALQGDHDGLGYLLSDDLSDSALDDALAAVHEATGRGSRRSFWSMPTRWKRSRLREWREDFARGGGPPRGGELDTDWRRRMFSTAWERNRDALKLEPSNPALDETLARFPSVPEGIREQLAEPNGHFRDGALRRIAEAKAPWSAPVLKAMLNDRDCGVRCGAAMALSWLDDTSIADTMIGLLKVNDSGARGYAASWLGKHRIKKALPMLIAAYADSCTDAQSGIIWGLATMADDSLVDFFADALESDQSYIRDVAVDALSKLKPEAALPHLRKACRDQNESVWCQAVKAIYAMEGQASYDWFLSCTKSPEPRLRAAGLFGVLHHKERPFPRELVWKILHDDDPTARLGAMCRLGEGDIIGDARIPVLQSYLREEDNDPKLRLEAAKHLAVHGDPLAVSEAVRLLKGDDRSLVWGAKQILERLGALSLSPGGAKTPVLKRILADRELGIDALSVAVQLAGSTRDRELLRPIIRLVEAGLDKLPAKRGYMEDYQRWSLLKTICSSLKEITGREFIDPGAVSSERAEIEKNILEWWNEQPESRREE